MCYSKLKIDLMLIVLLIDYLLYVLKLYFEIEQ